MTACLARRIAPGQVDGLRQPEAHAPDPRIVPVRSHVRPRVPRVPGQMSIEPTRACSGGGLEAAAAQQAVQGHLAAMGADDVGARVQGQDAVLDALQLLLAGQVDLSTFPPT